MGNQTLGEEYTGIVQANLEQRRVPTLTVRSVWEIYLKANPFNNLIKFCFSLGENISCDFRMLWWKDITQIVTTVTNICESST